MLTRLGRSQAEVYLWRSLGQIRLARLPLVRGPSDALRFVSDHLQPRGDFEVPFGLRNLLDEIVRKSYETPEARADVQSSLRSILQLRDKRLRDQRRLRRSGRDSQSYVLTKKLENIRKLMRGLDDVDGALALLGYRDQEIQDALQGYYLSLFDGWVVDEGAPALALLEELERSRLDRDARSSLLLLNQNFDCRDDIWQGAMYLRAVQLVRQAEERRTRPANAPEIARDNRKATELEEEARELLDRLIQAPGTFYSVRWAPRALAILGALWMKTGEWNKARETCRSLIDLDVTVRNRELTQMETDEISGIVRSAYLALADATYMAGEDYNQALAEYKHAADVHNDSPTVLWARYQLGNGYTLTDQDVYGLREFQSGRSLVPKFFGDTARKTAHWLTGEGLSAERRKVLEDILSETEGAVPAVEGQDGRKFWAQLFDAKIEYLNNKILKSTTAG